MRKKASELKKKNFAQGSTFAFGLETKKNLGQHFLNHAPTISKIADLALGFEGHPSVLEIGPGSGALTLELLKKGCRVEAVEKDTRAAQLLQSLSQDQLGKGELQVHNADILTFKPKPHPSGHPQLCVGNIPYYITSDILLWFLDNIDSFVGGVFMVQDEVGSRLASGPGSKEYGRISVRVQLQCSVEKALFVPAKMFSPPPKVDSAVIVLRKKINPYRSEEEVKKFERFTALLFSARRKMLRRILADRLNSPNKETGLVGDSELFWKSLIGIGIAPETRPDALSPDQILSLFRSLEQ